MTRNEYKAPNPKDAVTFVNIRVERSANGLFAGEETLVGVFAVDTSNESTLVVDTAGTLTSYYRHRGEDAAVATFTDYSTGILYGDYVVRQQIIRDCSTLGVVPSGITVTDWDSWRDQTFVDMQGKGLGRPADIYSFVPTSYTDEWEDLPSDIRRVTSVEVYPGGTEYWADLRGWDQRGRQLRIFHPNTAWTYKVYGRGQLRDLNDLDDELWGVLYWGMRWKYLLKRQMERVDFRPYLGRTRTADTPSGENYQGLVTSAYNMYMERIGDILQNEGIPSH